MEEGIWRTVAGRRIFIKNGQSLSEAMIKSGKFKYNGSVARNEKKNEKNEYQVVEKINPKEINEKINYYEKSIANEKVEVSVTFQEDGTVIMTRGEEESVGIYGDLKNAIVTHNHITIDGEIGGSFGKDDFDFIVNNQDKNVTLRAIDEKYTYQIKPIAKISINDYNNAYRESSLIDNDYKHCVMEHLKEKGLIEYERKSR